jgi:hypothetical protein
VRPATGLELGTDICEALGIDPSTVHTVRLDISVDDVAKVTTIGYAQPRYPVRQVLHEYTVVKRAGWAPPWPPPKLGDIYYKGGGL